MIPFDEVSHTVADGFDGTRAMKPYSDRARILVPALSLQLVIDIVQSGTCDFDE